MPFEEFSLEEIFAGYLINWDVVKKLQSYREPRWRTWLRKLGAWLQASNKQVKKP